MNQFFTILLLLTHLHVVIAQFSEQISTDRPGQAIGANSLGKNVLQIQTGMNFNSVEDVNFSSETLANNTVLRFGISEKFEISSLLDFANQNNEIGNVSNNNNGLRAFHIGGRYNLKENKGWIPAIGIQSRLVLPLQSEDFRNDHLGVDVSISTSNSLPANFSLTTNWIFLLDGNENDLIYNYVINLSRSLSNKLSAFVETYGNLNDLNHNIDAGFGYLINNNFLLDISAGWQGQNSTDDWFLDAGISYRWVWREAEE